MKYKKSLFMVIFLILLFTPTISAAFSSKNEYVGADVCKTCHEKQYEAWETSGHARILRKLSDAGIDSIPLPSGYDKKTITYVIGAYNWKALFLDRKGYLVTSTSAGDGKNQYNLKSKIWVDYLPGQKASYDCGRCHTTGYLSNGHQDGLEGIIGTWKFEGVQCEVCHGPGAAHAESSRKADIRIDRNICSKCHGTEPLDVIPLTGVFLAHYTEVNQLMKSKMRNLLCVVCHNPHLSSKKSIKQSCETCHQKMAETYKESYMYKVGVTCIDCHMPPAGMIAEGDTKTFYGDFKSHIFRIDHRKDFPALARNGQKINPGYLSVDYACMRCHSIYQNRQWASSFGMFAHKIKVTTDIKIMRFQMVWAYFGFFSAVIALLTGLYLKNLFLTSLKLNKKTVLTFHRVSAWITFSLYIFISAMCIYFHFPLDNLLKVLNLGWFLIHPVNGVLGVILYGGKIIAVRKYKKGWATLGLLWGVGTFVFWLIQIITVLFHFKIFEV